MIFLYTDGVTEAMDKEKNLFSEQRLINLIESKDYETPAQYIEEVNSDISKFVENTPQSDDITMLSIIYRGS
jgi:sigma-B regulation protein RsbU (phosphoserine phosphatase)